MSKVNKETEIEKAKASFDDFDAQVKAMTMDKANAAPKLETEEQTKMSTREQQAAPNIYLKPTKTFACRAPFNEKFRKEYEFAKEPVQFIAENHELIGEKIEKWTKCFPGVPYEFWEIPVNKPVWGPRYLAEEIKGCSYTRLTMNENKPTGTSAVATWTGAIVAESRIQRLDARPVSQRKSVF